MKGGPCNKGVQAFSMLGVANAVASGIGPQSMLYLTPTFTAMKRCMNQTRVVATADDKYSRRVDDLVAHLPQRVGHKRAHCPPQRRSFTPPTGRVHPFRSASCAIDLIRSPLRSVSGVGLD
jgi:hypothetical protein